MCVAWLKGLWDPQGDERPCSRLTHLTACLLTWCKRLSRDIWSTFTGNWMAVAFMLNLASCEGFTYWCMFSKFAFFRLITLALMIQRYSTWSTWKLLFPFYLDVFSCCEISWGLAVRTQHDLSHYRCRCSTALFFCSGCSLCCLHFTQQRRKMAHLVAMLSLCIKPHYALFCLFLMRLVLDRSMYRSFQFCLFLSAGRSEWCIKVS